LSHGAIACRFVSVSSENTRGIGDEWTVSGYEAEKLPTRGFIRLKPSKTVTGQANSQNLFGFSANQICYSVVRLFTGRLSENFSTDVDWDVAESTF
jgi:hypothetical protein